MTKSLDEYLGELVGRIVWSARRGHGTHITMEFGEPHLAIREPVHAQGLSLKASKVLERRSVSIVGDWSLWIRDSDWLITVGKMSATIQTTETKVASVLRDLDGQKLLSCAHGPFVDIAFDLGAKLHLGASILPEDGASVLWTLSRFGVVNS